MSLFEDIKKIVTDEEQLNQIQVLIANYEKGINTSIENYKAKIDKYKNDLKGSNESINKIKALFGVDENTPLNEELIKIKLSENKNEDISKIEEKYNEIITNLNNKYAEEKVELENNIKTLEIQKKDLVIEGKLKTIAGDINAQDGATDDIVRYLKENADIDDKGELVYKKDDIVLRNDKGYPLTISDRLEELKNTKKYLFKSDVAQGDKTEYGYPTNLNKNGTSDFAEKMRARARSLGINTY